MGGISACRCCCPISRGEAVRVCDNCRHPFGCVIEHATEYTREPTFGIIASRSLEVCSSCAVKIREASEPLRVELAERLASAGSGEPK